MARLRILTFFLPVQVPLTDISLMLVFVVVGVGVDDIFILVDFLDRQPAHLPVAGLYVYQRADGVEGLARIMLFCLFKSTHWAF